MEKSVKIKIQELCFSYAGYPILQDIDVCLPENRITAITGPSGTGKSTFLSILNRLWEENGKGHLSGKVEIYFQDGPVDIYSGNLPLTELRRRVGMVFQLPNPLPMSIFKNIAFPLRLVPAARKGEIDHQIEKALRQVRLFDEVKDRLHDDARSLSGGQQQRLCIARALMLSPEILLLDEPTSSLDSKACAGIEELLESLKATCTLVMVSHYQDQVRRIADRVYELIEGDLHQSR